MPQPGSFQFPPVHSGSEILICLRPTFAEVVRLRQMLDGSGERTAAVAEALQYLRERLCRITRQPLEADSEIHVVDNCYQYSGVHRGERVHWGACLE
jgi:hypothetical protein